jgi:hypothetical protein
MPFNWWIGIVEDRDDPLRLGRVRIRIINVHSSNISVTPTEDLPWATPLQPTTSAAVSGIGTAPVGLVTGTWCVGFFMDGDDMQQPIIMGTIGGMPDPIPDDDSQSETEKLENNPNVVRASDGTVVVDGSGNPIQSTPTVTTNEIITETLPPLSVEQIQKLMDAIGFKESSSIAGGRQNYTAQNRLGYIGKYQFGAMALATLGYVKIPVGSKLTNSVLDDAASWTGKERLKSKQDYFSSATAQEKIMFQNLKFNYNVLKRRGAISDNDTAGKVAGLLATSHLLGAGGAISFATGKDSTDANGTSGRTYYNVGASAVGETIPLPDAPTPQIPPNKDPATSLNSSNKFKYFPFTDPNKKYPLKDYANLPDTNKLAIGVTEKTQIESRNNTLRLDVPTATGSSWDEPPAAYGAKYPYNQTFQTEAGHLIEYDSSPGHERIHVYHKAGTYTEIDVNGTSVRKVVGDNYEILERNNYLYVRGAYTLTVDGATQILVKNKVDLQIYGDTNATINGDVNLKVAGDMSHNVGGIYTLNAAEMNFKTSGSFKLQASSDIKQEAGGAFSALASTGSIDAAPFEVNTGTSTAAGAIDLGTAPERLTVEAVDTSPLQRPEIDLTPFDQDAAEPGAEEVRSQQISAGNVNPEEVPAESEQAEPDPTQSTTEPVECDCTEFQGVTLFPDGLQLSKYFNLGQLSSRAAVVNDRVVAQRGLGRSQIVCNLKNLAVNCLDKIKEQYPDMIVTNAFRVDKEDRTNTSDHGVGMAADLQFTTRRPSDYFQIVQWIAANIPYKQLLLEYGGGARNPWIHIAFDKSGQKHALPYATFKDHRVYARNKFVNLA